MAIFNKTPKSTVHIGTAPEEPESAEEMQRIEQLDGNEDKTPIAPVEDKQKYLEVPVFLSQTQINNMIIENNMMLKQIISNI